MSNFDRAFERVLMHEGGYVNHPEDPGGETKYGISKRSYPDVNIGGLSIEDAKRIYKRDFWDACRCDEMPGVLAEAVFDSAVNSGKRAAALWLQKALGVEADGNIGPKTIAAANAAEPYKAAMKFYGQRLSLLVDLKHWPTFGRGWAKRIAGNLKDVG
jgi:lysozyme family protein